MKKLRKGFTLIELLVVIGILAILATVVIVVLNPAQLFAQGRDSRRIADLAGIRSAIVLYMATVTNTDFGSDTGGTFTCGTHFGASTAGASSTFTATTLAHGGVFTVGGAGWVAINLASTTGGSAIAVLPRDPTNTTSTGLVYGYSCDNTNKTFELNANMESARYASSGEDDVESTDGGNNPGIYEIGTDPDLNL